MGRDGSPNRPFADADTDLDRDNGGLGEPALPKGTNGLQESEKTQVGTVLRTVRSPTEIRTSVGITAGSESPPYLKALMDYRNQKRPW